MVVSSMPKRETSGTGPTRAERQAMLEGLWGVFADTNNLTEIKGYQEFVKTHESPLLKAIYDFLEVLKLEQLVKIAPNLIKPLSGKLNTAYKKNEVSLTKNRALNLPKYHMDYESTVKLMEYQNGILVGLSLAMRMLEKLEKD